MSEEVLRDRRVLIVEDEYLLADDITVAIEGAGAVVLGPVPSIDGALALIASEPQIDFALLDVNLRGDFVFPVADALMARDVPFAFATGYDEWALPERFADVPRIEKPLKANRLLSTLSSFLSPA
jgi:CheY-like chemotaxis protein